MIYILNTRYKFFKMFASILDIQYGGSRVDRGIRNNDHDVRIGREGINEGTKT